MAALRSTSGSRSLLHRLRATEDVDVVCEVATRSEYYRLGNRLRERGLREATDEAVICRWKDVDSGLVLDVMPIAPRILGFSNPWYGEAIATAATVTLDSGVEIRAARPTTLVATKLAAWRGRGKGDLLRSLDIHDVLILVDGRPEIDAYFDYAVDSATSGYGPLGAERAALVRGRFQQCILRC